MLDIKKTFLLPTNLLIKFFLYKSLLQ